MKISVIVPTYKPQVYLWECLDSIYNQTFPKTEYELILVLNGCNEPYNAQIKDWLAKHSDLQLQYIQTDEAGVSNARNMALDVARGGYISFVDDDDYISTFCLEELYRKVSQNTIALCYPYAFNDGNINEQIQYSITEAYEYCTSHKCKLLTSKVSRYFNGPWMKLIPMSFIQDRRYDIKFKNGEDSLFMFLISDKIKRVAFTSKNAVYFRRYRKDSAVTRKRNKSEIIINSFNLIKAYSCIYFKTPKSYSLSFFITRLLGTLRSMFK